MILIPDNLLSTCSHLDSKWNGISYAIEFVRLCVVSKSHTVISGATLGLSLSGHEYNISVFYGLVSFDVRPMMRRWWICTLYILSLFRLHVCFDIFDLTSSAVKKVPWYILSGWVDMSYLHIKYGRVGLRLKKSKSASHFHQELVMQVKTNSP